MGDRRGKNKEIHYAKHLKTPFCSNCVPSLGPMTKCQAGWMLLKLTTNSSNSDSWWWWYWWVWQIKKCGETSGDKNESVSTKGNRLVQKGIQIHLFIPAPRTILPTSTDNLSPIDCQLKYFWVHNPKSIPRIRLAGKFGFRHIQTHPALPTVAWVFKIYKHVYMSLNSDHLAKFMWHIQSLM